MASRKVKSDPLAALRQQEKQEAKDRQIKRQQENYQALVKKFKPAKKFRGKIIPVAVGGKFSGKAVPTSHKGKVILVKVAKSGKVAVHRERKGEKLIHPKRVGSYRVITGRSKAQREFYAKLIPTKHHRSRILPTPGEKLAGTGVSMDRFLKELSKDLRARRRAKSGRSFIVTITFKVSEVRKPFTAIAEFKLGHNQELTAENIRNWLFGPVWSQVAQWLTRHDLVSFGSAAYISRLLVNRYEEREDWQARRDNGYQKWGKHNFEEIGFKQIVWDIERVAIGNERDEREPKTKTVGKTRKKKTS